MRTTTEELVKKEICHCDVCGKECGTHWADDPVKGCVVCKKDLCNRDSCVADLGVDLVAPEHIPFSHRGLSVDVCVPCYKKYSYAEFKIAGVVFIEREKK